MGGGRKNKGVFCSYSEIISRFATEDGFSNFFAMNIFGFFMLVVDMQGGENSA